MIFTAASFAFVALHLAPGDPVSALAEGTPPEVRAHLRQLYALDQSLASQYLHWLGALLQGDLGYSIGEHRDVVDVLATKLANTFLLVIPAFTLSVVIGTLVGIWQAASAGDRRDRVTSWTLLVVYSMPEFWLALALVLVFARWWHVLPPNGITRDMYAYLSPMGQLKDRLAHMVLPVMALTAVGVATFARYQRASMRQALSQAFVQTARAGGLPRWRVLYTSWRVALLPIVTLAGLLLPAYLAGVVFVEQVFAWPGVGTLLVKATAARDYALVSGAVVVGSAITALTAAAAELVRAALDPRLGGSATPPSGSAA